MQRCARVRPVAHGWCRPCHPCVSSPPRSCREIEYEDLQLQRNIGEGSFGSVFLAKARSRRPARPPASDLAACLPCPLSTLCAPPSRPMRRPAPSPPRQWHETPVAVKLLVQVPEGGAGNPQGITLSSPQLYNLHKECSLMASLRHPNIVQASARRRAACVWGPQRPACSGGASSCPPSSRLAPTAVHGSGGLAARHGDGCAARRTRWVAMRPHPLLCGSAPATTALLRHLLSPRSPLPTPRPLQSTAPAAR